MFLIVGLGNPSSKYDKTRHNVGFDVIDELADKYNIAVNIKKHKAMIGKGVIDGMKVMLVKPQTFMNNSGESVIEILDYYKLSAEEDMVIISDDISLDCGRIRVRKKGSDGGHNGLKDIIAWTDTNNFPRVRVGIGDKPKGWDLADHVLGRFTDSERKLVDESIADAAKACVMVAAGNVDEAMNRYNGKAGG